MYTNASPAEQVREKRGLIGMAIPILGKLATIAIEALGSHLQNGYVLAIPQASSYYDMRLVTFGIDEDDRLVVCFPIFVKDFSRKPMTLYQIETVPVPILDTNEEANSYSQAVINKPYIATNNDNYIQLKIEELFICKQIKHIYFCEELFLVKHKTKQL